MPGQTRMRITGAMVGENVDANSAFTAEDAAAAERLKVQSNGRYEREASARRFCEDCLGPVTGPDRFCSEKCRQRSAVRVEC